MPDDFLNKEDYEFLISYFSGATFMPVIRWLTDGAQEPPEQFLNKLRRIEKFMHGQIKKQIDEQVQKQLAEKESES